MAQNNPTITDIMSNVHEFKNSTKFRDLIRRHYRVPFYLPDKQIFKWLEKKGIMSEKLRIRYEVQMAQKESINVY